jgi:hypothetical protein
MYCFEFADELDMMAFLHATDPFIIRGEPPCWQTHLN